LPAQKTKSDKLNFMMYKGKSPLFRTSDKIKYRSQHPIYIILKK
jgi:hypothetical protein